MARNKSYLCVSPNTLEHSNVRTVPLFESIFFVLRFFLKVFSESQAELTLTTITRRKKPKNWPTAIFPNSSNFSFLSH